MATQQGEGEREDDEVAGVEERGGGEDGDRGESEGSAALVPARRKWSRKLLGKLRRAGGGRER